MRRSGWLGGAVAGAVALLAACSTTAVSGQGVPVNTAAPSAIDAAYRTTVAAGSARISLSAQLGGAAANGSVQTVTGTGTENLTAGTADLNFTLPDGSAPTEIRYLDGMVYERLPAGASTVESNGRPWISVNVRQVLRAQYGAGITQLSRTTPTDPSSELAYLRGIADTVTDLGPDTVAGTPTTHYRGTVDLDRAGQLAGAPVQPAITALEQQLGSTTLPVDVWLDAQGRVRKLVLDEQVSQPAATPGSQPTSVRLSVTVTLSDFGVAADITAPPADQVTDVTDEFTGGH